MAVDSNLGAAVGVEEGTIASISRNEGRIAQAWVNVRGGLRVFSVYFWHSEGWAPRNEALLEAVVKQANTTRHPWLVPCDANTCPGDFDKSLWFRRERMHVVAPKEASTCRSKGPKGEWIERTYDYVVACNSLRGKLSQMKVVEDFESRPHKAVSFVVERETKRYRNGMSRRCLRRCLATVEEGCQEEARGKRQRRRGGRKGQHRETSKV